MTTTPHYHVGILVYDLDAARAHFERALGVTFADITERTIEFAGPPPSASTIRLCYSTQGPPYYELVEAVEDGLFGRDQGEGLHHVGVFVSDAEAEQHALEHMGVSTEFEMARVHGPLGVTTNLAWFNDPNTMHGVRFEFVDDVVKPQLQAWLQSLGRVD